MKVFIISPANCATGGPELLQQFARGLIDCGVEAYMLYPDSDGISCPVPEVYWKYDVPYVSRYVDARDSVLVLAETRIHHIHLCQKGTVMVWWLSVNNYLLSYEKHITKDNLDIFHLKARTNVLHFVQSYYAKDFLEKRMGITEVYFLKDYINDEIIGCASLCRERYERKNVCLFNPKKGYAKLEPIIKACRGDIQWVPLTGYTPLEMANVMCQAKVYVDFGSHPGKDRVPREAAVCGCCILTNQEGSAAYQEDVEIPESYKVGSTEDVELVLSKIYDLMDHYEKKIGDYKDYRRTIEQEKAEFMQEVQTTIAVLQAKIGDGGQGNIALDYVADHEKILDSLDSAISQIKQLISESKAAIPDGGDVSSKLLSMDYMIQIIRETIYIELSALSDMEDLKA